MFICSSFERWRRRASRQRKAEQTRLALACNSCSFHAASWAVFCDKCLPKINFVTGRPVQLRQQLAGVRLRSLLGALLRFWWEKRIVTIVYTTGFLSSTTNLLMSSRVQARFNGTSRVSDKILENAVDHVNRPRFCALQDSVRSILTGVFRRC